MNQVAKLAGGQETSKPLTLLRAFRIYHRLDALQTCIQANISRSYLTRLEFGAVPSPDFAAKFVTVLNEVDALRSTQHRDTELRQQQFEEARAFIERAKSIYADFEDGRLCESHLLYPDRYVQLKDLSR